MRSAFLVSKGLLCLYDKQNNKVACRYGISLLVVTELRVSQFCLKPYS